MLRIIAKTLLTIALVLIVATSAIIIKPDWFKGLAGTAVQATTGLQLEIDHIETRLAPARMELAGLRLLNPAWPEPLLLSTDRLVVLLTASPFAQKPFWRLSASDIDLRFAENSEGRSNWMPRAGRSPAAGGEPQSGPGQVLPTLPRALGFDQVRIDNIAVQWRGGGGSARDFHIPALKMDRTGAGRNEASFELHVDGEVFAVEARTELPGENRSDLNYRLTIDHPHLAAASAGNLTPGLTGSVVDLQADMDSLAAFAPLLGVSLPAFRSVELDTRLHITEHYELRDFRFGIGDNHIAGRIGIDPATKMVHADLKSGGIHLLPILKALPESAEEAAQTEERELDWSALNAWSSELEVALEDFHAGDWSANNMRLAATTDDGLRLSMRAARIANAASEMEFPDVDIAALLQPLAGKTLGPDLDIEMDVGLGDQFAATVAGRANINGVPGTALEIEADGSSAAVWDALALPYRDAGRLKLAGELDTNDAGFNQQLEATLGEQWLQGDMQYRFGDPAHATINAAVRNVDLRFMQAENPPPEPEPKEPSKRMFNDEPIDFSILRSHNADIRLTINNTHTGYSHLESLTIVSRLQDGVLKIERGTTAVEGGEATFDLTLDTGTTPPQLATSLQVEGSDFGAMGLTQLAQMQGGDGTVDIKLNTSGATSHALASNLNGRANIQIQDLTANNTRLNRLGSDLIYQTFQQLNPFAEQETHTEFKCVAMHFEAEDGRLKSDKNIILETDKMKIIGTGHVDFNDETLSLSFTPIARKGLGINLSNMVQLVRVGGTLTNPRLVADAGGVMTSTLSTGAAVYTGGLSLLAEKLIQRAVNFGSACDPDAEPVEYEIPTAAQPEDGQSSEAPKPEAAETESQ